MTAASKPAISLPVKTVQWGFAGVLLIMLGLKLLDSLKVYAAEHRIRLGGHH